jgi:hypothetical protein
MRSSICSLVLQGQAANILHSVPDVTTYKRHCWGSEGLLQKPPAGSSLPVSHQGQGWTKQQVITGVCSRSCYVQHCTISTPDLLFIINTMKVTLLRNYQVPVIWSQKCHELKVLSAKSQYKPERILKDAQINNISLMCYSLQQHTVFLVVLTVWCNACVCVCVWGGGGGAFKPAYR